MIIPSYQCGHIVTQYWDHFEPQGTHAKNVGLYTSHPGPIFCSILHGPEPSFLDCLERETWSCSMKLECRHAILQAGSAIPKEGQSIFQEMLLIRELKGWPEMGHGYHPSCLLRGHSRENHFEPPLQLTMRHWFEELKPSYHIRKW